MFILLQRIFMLFASHLAAFCTAFSGKSPQNGCKWRCLQINIHFDHSHATPLFASKQTFARIDYLRQGWQLVSRKGTHNVKFLAENLTKSVVPNTRVWAMAWQACTLSAASSSGCRDMLLTGNSPVRSLTCPLTINGMQPKGASRL